MSDSISHIPPAVTVTHGTTLRDHVLAGMRAAPGATGEFTSLLIARLARDSHHRVARAASGARGFARVHGRE